MKNLFKKLTCILLVAVMSLSITSLFACGGGSSTDSGNKDEAVDTTKTQIYIGNQNYGFGDSWLKSAIKKFEAANANTSFEDGKKGVQVYYTNGSAYGSNTLLQTIDTQGCDIFFGENTQYYDFISGGAMLDITDIVTEPLTEYGETKSIADKLSSAFSSYLKTSERKNSSGQVVIQKDHYYALPNYECTYYITYNKTYFNENNLFFGNDGQINCNSSSSNLSKGPDGEANTYDDGLPATLDEFFTLCDKIADVGGIPICWPGQVESYKNVYISSLTSGFEGKEQSEIRTSFSGTATHIVKVDGNGDPMFDANGDPILDEPTTINSENGYKVYWQAGRYYAIKFFEQILRNSYSTGDNRNHVDNQMDYLNSNYNGQTIAMLFDGNFWTNEAEEAIDTIVNTCAVDDADAVKDNFAVMPFPKPNSSSTYAGKNAYSIGVNDLAFIYAKIPENRLKAAKAFIRFLYTDEMLKDYTNIVDTSRGCDVTYTESELNNLNGYAKSCYQFRKEADLIGTIASEIYTNHMTDFIDYKIGVNATLDTDYNSAINYLINHKNSTAQDYFKGIIKYHSASFWSNLIG